MNDRGPDLLLAALGGDSAVEIAQRWRTDTAPLPAAIAVALREHAMHVIGVIQNEAWRLKSGEVFLK